MKLAVCVLLAASGVSALTPPKSVAAATRGGSLEGGALKAAAPAIKEVSAVSRGGVIANFVGVDVALLSYFFFWYLGNYYCPRPRPNLRGDGAATSCAVAHFKTPWGPVGVALYAIDARAPEFEEKNLTRIPASQTTSRTSSRSRTAAAPRASP